MLKSFRLKNFKAVHDSQLINFEPLTVFIGNNGSGKSSLIEGLETFHAIVEWGLDKAMQNWRGFEHVWYKGISHKPNTSDIPHFYDNPMTFELTTVHGKRTFYADMTINLRENVNGDEPELLIQHEKVTLSWPHTFEDGTEVIRQETTTHNMDSKITFIAESEFADYDTRKGIPFRSISHSGYSIILPDELMMTWQFVSLAANRMGHPVPQKRTGGVVHLAKDGSNVAEYILSIYKQDSQAFAGILETLQYIMPYIDNLQAIVTSELELAVHLQLTEQNFQVPGWLLSTGTLRILALLALFRHPHPPDLIVIEELENGLDPRTIHLIVDEIRHVVEDGICQVIITTHFPYLLDLFHLSQIVIVERIDGQPIFSRPADNTSLQTWVKPGLFNAIF